jgi:hypothetical protein
MALLSWTRAARAALLALTALGAPHLAQAACSSPQGGAGRSVPDTAGPIAVVGVLTEFGSLCVNGLQIHYDERTPVTVNGRMAHPRDLALGQVLAVEARAAGGQLAAQNIAIVRVLEGPITRVNAAAGTVHVMDQAVRVTDETMGRVREQLAELKPGATVEVSGHRNARGEVVASRMDFAPPRSGHSVIGRMKQNSARSGAIGGLEIALPASRGSGESDVMVRGLWDGGALRAGNVTEDPAMHLLGRADRAVVESLVQEPRRGDRLRVGALQVRMTKATRIEGTPAAALRIDQSVQVTGVPDRRSGMAAERIRITPAGRLQTQQADRRTAPAEQAAARAEGADPGRHERMGRDNPSALRVERVERQERDTAIPERAERVERREPARVERPEPTRVERPEIERIVERLVERPERAEKVERPERSDRSGSNSGRN